MKHFKQIRAFFTAVAVAAGCFAVTGSAAAADSGDPAPRGVATLFGDVNYDQAIGMLDAVQLQRFLLGTIDELGNSENADLYEDGEIDVFDMAMLKKQIVSGASDRGGKLTIKIVDMMTGEPIDDVRVSLFGMFDNVDFSAADWIHDADTEDVLTGLPLGEKYQYVLDLSNLPDEYCNGYGNWDQQLIFSFDGETDKEITLRVLSDKDERNVKINLYDWGLGDNLPYCGMMNVTDKDGNPYYPSLHFEDIALPDGEYHVDLTLFDYPVQLLDMDSDFAKELQALFPDVDFTDQSAGFDFTVKDGKADRELSFDLMPLEDKSNHISVNCINAATGEPLEGVELSLIEDPKGYARTVETWTSDSSGARIIEGLKHSGFPAYTVKVDKVPEGFAGGYDENISWGYVYDYGYDVNYYFTPADTERNVTANILHYEDQALINDTTTFDVFCTDPEDPLWSNKVCSGMAAGEAFYLPDGVYFAALNTVSLDKMGYEPIHFFTEKGKKLAGEFEQSEFIGGTDIVSFTVKDGKADHALTFYLKDYEPDTATDEVDFDDLSKYIDVISQVH